MAMSRVSIADPNQANPGRSRPGRPGKRLVLCEDGTWENADSNDLQNDLSVPTNVTRIGRAIKPLSSDGIPQVVYYHWGVGGLGGFTQKLMGATGRGLGEIVREGYEFLATNYVPGDEIFIFGFSRGAYTARCIAGLVAEIGILTNEGLPFFSEIYRDVKHQHERNYRPKYPNLPFPDKPSAEDPKYRAELQRRKLTILNVPIKVVGVWDTVGALGVPKIGWLSRVGLQSSTMKELSFHDTALSSQIEHAFQALSLDERRFSFQPTLWEKPEGNTTTLRQVWFPGAHANIGGSYDDQQIATITLAWMMAQCQSFLDFDVNYLHEQWEQVDIYYENTHQKVRPWSFGKAWNGLQSFYAYGGSKVRTPGRYCYVEADTGRLTNDPLINTHEYIHPCVRSRINLHGPGLQDVGEYECKSLNDWKLIIEPPESGRNSQPNVYWRSRRKPAPGFAKTLPEAPLWQLEIDLLHYDPDIEQYVMKPSPVRQQSSQRRRSQPPDGSRPPNGSRPPDGRWRPDSRPPPNGRSPGGP